MKNNECELHTYHKYYPQNLSFSYDLYYDKFIYSLQL